MNNQDRENFMGLIEALCGTHGRHMTSGIAQGFWIALEDLPWEIVEDGIHAAIREAKEFPSAQSIRQSIIESADGHMSPEEAWAWVPKDDGESKFVTAEMLRAWTVAGHDYDAGNVTGARIAFIAEYRRALRESREAGQPATWFMSSGTGMTFEQSRYAEVAAIEQAAVRGLLARDHAMSLIGQQYEYLGLDAPKNHPLLTHSGTGMRKLIAPITPEERDAEIRRRKELNRHV